MSKHDHRVTLHQIGEFARRAQEICARKTLKELLSDWQATLALERALEILGEAVKRLPDDLRDRYPQVEWKAVVSHGYDAIDYEILWKAVHEQLPALLTTVEQMLRDAPGVAAFPDAAAPWVTERAALVRPLQTGHVLYAGFESLRLGRGGDNRRGAAARTGLRLAPRAPSSPSPASAPVPLPVVGVACSIENRRPCSKQTGPRRGRHTRLPRRPPAHLHRA